MASLPEPFKKKNEGGKFVQSIVRNNNEKKSGKEIPKSQRDRPGTK